MTAKKRKKKKRLFPVTCFQSAFLQSSLMIFFPCFWQRERLTLLVSRVEASSLKALAVSQLQKHFAETQHGKIFLILRWSSACVTEIATSPPGWRAARVSPAEFCLCSNCNPSCQRIGGRSSCGWTSEDSKDTWWVLSQTQRNLEEVQAWREMILNSCWSS